MASSDERSTWAHTMLFEMTFMQHFVDSTLEILEKKPSDDVFGNKLDKLIDILESKHSGNMILTNDLKYLKRLKRHHDLLLDVD
jgi:hypothetical protein